MKRGKWPKRISTRQQKRLREYARVRRAFLAVNTKCCVFPSELAVDVHHPFGRLGSLLCDDRWFLAVSRKAHTLIGDNPEAARQRGLLAPRGLWNTVPQEDDPRVIEMFKKHSND